MNESSRSALRSIIELQNRIVASGLNPEAVMATVVRELPKLLPQTSGAVIELQDGQDMVYRAGSGIASRFIGMRLPMAGSLSGLCVRERQPLYAADTETDERVDRGACRILKIRSMICHPLVANGETVGVCKSFCAQPEAFADGDLETLGSVAGIIASSLANATQFEEAVSAGKVDSLTGLGNRRAFDEALDREMARSLRGGEPLTVALIDLNGFKELNDNYGHAAGDAALANFGAALAAGVRTEDEAYRLGGDEFCVLFPRATVENSEALVKRLRAAVSEIGIMNQPLKFSAGLAQYQSGDAPEALLARAD